MVEEEAVANWRPAREGDLYVFYRIAETDPPTITDFLTAQARGRNISKKATQERLDDWAKRISVFQTEDLARATELAMRALRPPRPIGDFIARLLVPVIPAGTSWKATPPEGHFTLEGAPTVLLECVHLVVAV